MSIVLKDNLKNLIEPHFHKYLQKESYEVISKKALDLLTHTRFDLAFKLFYLDIKERNEKLAKEVYLEHIRAFSLGKFSEPGNKEKVGKGKFLEEFEKTFESIKKDGFDSSKTLVPLSHNGSIANGVHRVASAIYLEKKVDCVEIETGDHIYDYDFFYKRGVSANILDMVATKFVEFSDNVYIAFIWPIGVNKDKEVERIISNIVYKKRIKLTPNGARNLLSQIYYSEEWLGSIENGFSGANAKLVECFKTFDEFSIYAFQAKSLDEVLDIKEKIRDIFKVGKHSVHITDTKEEALRVARVVFNDNSLHFLNYAKPTKFLSTYEKIEKFREFLKVNDIESKDVLIDSSMILSCCGLREAKDVDFLCADNAKINTKFNGINIHDEELKYYKKKKEDLIYDTRNYFYFEDLKFLSLNLLYEMKKNRDEEKDRNDCKMMEALIEDNKFKKIISSIKQKVYYAKIKSRQQTIDILQKIGLYEVVRKVYRKIV